MIRSFCIGLIITAVLGIAYVGWVKRAYPPEDVSHNSPRHETQTKEHLAGETQPGPVEPVPSEKDHVAGVMQQEDQEALDEAVYFDFSMGFPKGAFWLFCDEQHDCKVAVPPTYDTLKRAGVEIVCENAFGKVPNVNYWPEDMPMACSKIREVKITNSKIKVTKEKP